MSSGHRPLVSSAEPADVTRPRRLRVWLSEFVTASTLAWAACGISVALLGSALLLVVAVLNSPPAGGHHSDWTGHTFSVAAALGAPILGGLIAYRRPANRYGWVWCRFAFAMALWLFSHTYAMYGLAERGALPGHEPAVAVAHAAWMATITIAPFLLLLFPDGHLPGHRWRLLVWMIAVVGLVLIGIGPLVPGESYLLATENPFGVGGRVGDGIFGLVVAGVIFVIGSVIVSAASLLFRYRRASGIERQQIKWFAFATLLFGGTAIASGILGLELPGVWNDLLQAGTVAALHVAVGFAILRYRLYDIDLIVNRALVYGALSACVVGIYVLVVGYLGAFFRSEENLPVSLAAAATVAVAFQPLRAFFQRSVDRMMYGERNDPYRALSRLGERLEVALEPSAVLPTIVRTVREALRLPYAAIALGDGDDLSVATASGTPAGDLLCLPLAYHGGKIGELVVARRGPGEEFSRDDRRLLDDLARQAGIAVHAVRLTSDVQRSRQRIVATREEERRRLRRDLHDGLGPALGSLTLKLDIASDLMETDPPAARAMLRDVKTQAQAAISDIRRVVYELRPPALDDLGLLGALREVAAQHGEHGLTMTLEIPENLPDLPAAVEVAVYRIVQESLSNVARHASARACTVRLDLDETERLLYLEVRDNGRGLPGVRQPGVGLFSMSERASELGGECTVEPLPAGGTLVRALLPCETSDLGADT